MTSEIGGDRGDDPLESWVRAMSAPETEMQALFLQGMDASTHTREALIAKLSSAEHRAWLGALFAAHDALPPEQPHVASPSQDPLRRIGDCFGEFTVTAHHASGGTADVYLARQKSPSREVVLKIRRARHGTAGQLRRFLEEAERLAQFSHPGVAHMYGSGISQTPDGSVAWIAMERIDGVSLQRWRDGAPRSTLQRYAIIRDIANIVAAAHRAEIIHRDLSPSNISVDADGRPRIIDYGISRTLQSIDNHRTIEGTPGFASPEQSRGQPAARSDDVYALGRLLAWIAPDAPAAVSRIVALATGSNEDRPPVDAFISSLNRAITPPRRGRNIALAMITLVLFAATAFYLTRTEVGTQDVATAKASSEAVDRILSALLESATPSKGGTSQTTVLNSIGRAETQIAAETGAPAQVRWRALERIAVLWRDFGDFKRSASAAMLASEIASKDTEAHELISLRLRCWSVTLLARSDDVETARVRFKAAYADVRAAAADIGDGAVAPPDGPDRIAHVNFAQANIYLGVAAMVLGDLATAEECTDRAAPFHTTGVFKDTVSAVTYFINSAKLKQAAGEIDEAVALAAIAVEASRIAEAGDEVAQLATRSRQATILEVAGQFQEAAIVYQESLDAWTRIGGPNHPTAITALNNLGLNALRQGDHARAITLLTDACARALITHGPEHQYTLDDNGNLAMAFEAAGRLDEAIATIERLLPIVQRVRGSPSIDECDWLLYLGRLRLKQKRPEDARALFDRVLIQGAGLRGAEVNLFEAQKEIDLLGKSRDDR